MSRGKLGRYIPLFLMMVPGLLYLFINNYIPISGLVIAFKDVNFQKGILGSDWVGLDNFKYLFKTADAFIITRNTILYNLVFIVAGTALAVILAIAVNDVRSRLFARASQSVIILPALISMVVVSVLVYSMLSFKNGVMNNHILPLFGIDPVMWYDSPEAWPTIIVLVYFWKNAGFQCIIFLSALLGISSEYYEAAKIDGATKWQQITRITLPMLKPAIIMVTVLALGKIFYSDFGLFYQVPMDAGALYSTTNTIDTYVFRGLTRLGDIGMSSAAGMYQSMVGLILVLVSNGILRRYSKENALF